jgi:outer membrane cobalamin receptor
MSSSTPFKAAALTLIFAIVGATAGLAEPPNKQVGDKYVFVTGSRIPQKVKVKSIGTATVSPLSVIKRREIDRSGRFTTEGVVALDPSVRVVSGRGGSGF